MPSGGGPARQLTNDDSLDGWPTWSPDSREIAFVSERSGQWEIWVITREGGEQRQVTEDVGVLYPKYSPDGKWLIFNDTYKGNRSIWKIPSAGGEVELVTPVPGTHAAAYSPDGTLLYFMRHGDIWALSIDGGTEYPVTDLKGRRGGFFRMDLATDGEYVYFVWEEDIGDIWVVDVVNE
jgi:Tol biopolymer transport system component